MDANKPRPLTAKQQRFVEEYLVDRNATQAAIRAGYSKRNADKIGSELLGKTRVAAAVREATEALAEKTGVTAAQVVEGLLAEAQRFGEGASHGARVSAWKHLGEHLGMFVNKSLHVHKRIEDMTEDELRAFLGEGPGAHR